MIIHLLLRRSFNRMFKLLRDFQKQGADIFKNFENRFLESNTFNILKEKYQSLNRGQQSLFKYGLILFLLISVFYFPASYLFSSIGSWSEFKQKYILSLELLRFRKTNSSLLGQDIEGLKIEINRVVEKYASNDFQITDKDKPFLRSKSVRQVDFNIGLKHLNIRQAIRLGTELNALPQMRLEEVSLSENTDYPKHYDIIYILEAFVSRRVKDRAPVVKRRLINRNKKPSSHNADKSQNLDDRSIQKRKKRRPRKRKTLGDQ